MVMLVWFVLSLFDICEFTWLPVFIDALCVLVFIIASGDSSTNTALVTGLSFGIASFAFYKFFFKLSVSAWWIIISPAISLLAVFVPGGHTIANLLLDKYNLINLPTWGLILGIIIDVIYLVSMGYLLVDSIKNKKNS